MVERIRILDARTVVTTMERHPPEAHQPWGATAYISRAQQAYTMRRAEQLAGLDYQSRVAIHRRDDAAHIHRHHNIEVQMIGDQPFNDAMRDHPELLQVSVRDIPGYRLVYDFPGLTVRAERLWPALRCFKWVT